MHINFSYQRLITVLFSIYCLLTTSIAIAIPTPEPGAYYNLSNAFLKEGKLLGVVNGKLVMYKKPQSADNRLLWKFTAIKGRPGYFRITNVELGNGKSLDSSPTAPHVATNGNYTGQFWKLTDALNGHVRLSNMYQPTKSLDTSGKAPHAPFLGKSGNISGQLWKLTPIGSAQKIAAQVKSSNITAGTSIPLETASVNLDVTLDPMEKVKPVQSSSTQSTPILVRGAFGKVGMSRATCGLPGQSACGYTPAKLINNAVKDCPKGTFFDLTNWSCWSCPEGFERSAAAVHTERACRARFDDLDANRIINEGLKKPEGKTKKATFQGPLCPKGSFFDPIRSGECYSCPGGYNRSAAHITEKNACYIPAREDFKKAVRKKTTIWPHDCARGTFFDAVGGCFKCPDEYVRTGHSVQGAKACSQATAEQHKHATVVQKAECGPGEIKDAWIGGTQSTAAGGGCWTCPTGWDRTIHPIYENKACEQDANFVFASATETQALSCPKGQVFDLISTEDTRVEKALSKRNNELEKKDNIKKDGRATCWQCPDTADRTVEAVYSNKACRINHLNWKSAKYKQRGLFGLDGAEQVALDLVKGDGTLINSITDELDMSSRKDVWEQIATAPQSSNVLNLAVYARLIAAMEDPQKATVAEQQLLKSTAAAIRDFRVFIAQDALDAYDAWARARDEDESRARNNTQQTRLSSSNFSGGSKFWDMPPNFDEIILQNTLIALSSGGSTSTTGTMMMLGKNFVTKNLFPYRYRPYNSMQFNSKMIGPPDIEKMVQAINKKLPDKPPLMYKPTVEKMVIKTASQGGKMARLARAAASIGPQIVMTIAIEGLTYAIERIIDTQNAKPFLLANLASAKQPLNLKRMTAKEVGARQLLSDWEVIMSANTPPQRLAQFALLAKAKK